MEPTEIPPFTVLEGDGDKADHEKYWASEKEEEKLVSALASRRDDYFNFIDASRLHARISRNWHYYYNLFTSDAGIDDMEIQKAGEEGEYALIAINHFRSLLHLILTYTVQNRPAWDTLAVNSDYKSLAQARVGNDILDFYMEDPDKGAEPRLRQAAEDGLIFGAGFMKVIWDDSLGQEVAADPATGEVYKEGDVSFSNPTIFDVIHNPDVQDWNSIDWLYVRTRRNKWDMVALYPAFEEDILNVEPDEKHPDYGRFDRIGAHQDTADLIDIWEFYHKRTPAMPDGRQVIIAGDTILDDRPLEYREIPVYRIVPAEFRLTSFGYSPGFDLQGLQEGINSVASSIVTIINHLGLTKIWFKTGDQVNIAELEPGIDALQCDTKPEPLILAQIPRDEFNLMSVLRGEMEYVSGVNSVARGQPEASLKSGAALALVDQKAMQYASLFVGNFYLLLCRVGTAILLTLKSKSAKGLKRAYYIAGISNRSEMKEFASEDLENIDRVSVQAGNPLSRTIAGRSQIATDLLTKGLIKTPEEYLTVLETGQLKPMTETLDSQLNVIHDENDKLKNGQPCAALMTDDQCLHIKKHAAVLDSCEMRNDPIIAPNVQAHVLQHMQLLVNPAFQAYAQVLQYPAPLAPAMPSPGGPPGNEAGGQPNAGPMMPPAPGAQPQKGPKLPEPAQANLNSAAMETAPPK